MSDFDKKVSQIQNRLNNLVDHQQNFQKEIDQLRFELNLLKSQHQQTFSEPQVKADILQPEKAESQKTEIPLYVPPPKQEERQQKTASNKQPETNYQPNFSYKTKPKITPRENSSIEKFIGENLISKIGIVILVIGVGIGAKYAIDNNLISPLMRIVLGYAMGIGLVGLAVKLKPKYLNFSAVLLSGGMAIMYFITFFAYSLYSLINQPITFVLMLMFTVFTVASALNYNRQIIAHIGLVGAYAVPFLLSDGSGNFAFLFSYIAVINIGILAISLYKYWKPLFYSSYIVTWLTFYGWYLTKYSGESHFYLAFFFLTVFFLIFYLTFIAYKLVSKENIAIENVSLILANSFIFYGLGYSILSDQPGFENYLGMFTLSNAAIHFAFAFAISRLKLVTIELVYLTAALVLTFITIAVPVQMDGSYVTLAWTAEAAILFWIGRTKQIPLFENFSYPLMALASFSVLIDWGRHFISVLDYDELIYPIFNQYFAVSFFFVLAFSAIWYLDRNKKYLSSLQEQLSVIATYIISAILLFAIYNTFRGEVSSFSKYLFLTTNTETTGLNSYVMRDDFSYSILWQMNYTMLFLTALSFLNIKKFKNPFLGFANLFFNALTVLFFITYGLIILGDLRRNFLSANGLDVFNLGIVNLSFRYLCYLFFAGLCFATYRYTKQEFLIKIVPAKVLTLVFDFAFYFTVLVIISVEFSVWMDIFNFNQSTKLGLSILWGIYAVFLIVLGIVQRKLHLRIFAIILFAITLVKLFIYDIADLNTISKTVVFVSLGILLLIISFLYTKYKKLIFDDNETEEKLEDEKIYE